MAIIPQMPSQQSIRVSPLTQEAGPTVVNRQLRELFREAFDQLGGAQWLVEFAMAEPANARVFVAAISKLLPAAANPTTQERIIIDVPWLTRERLSYKEGAMDLDVVDLLPRQKDA